MYPQQPLLPPAIVPQKNCLSSVSERPYQSSTFQRVELERIGTNQKRWGLTPVSYVCFVRSFVICFLSGRISLFTHAPNPPPPLKKKTFPNEDSI